MAELSKSAVTAVEEFKLQLQAETEFFDGLAPLLSTLLRKVGSRNRLFASMQRVVKNHGR